MTDTPTTGTNPMSVSPDPSRIFLQPSCCVSPHEGRQWCEDNVWPVDGECEATGVEYVRADLSKQEVRPTPASMVTEEIGGVRFQREAPTEEQRERAKSGIYKSGDCFLAWIEEGSLDPLAMSSMTSGDEM